MSKSATKYTIITINSEGVETPLEGTKAKKATAVELAREVRKDNRVGVRVETNAGNVVFEAPAPKHIKMSPRYTRVVELPEGAHVPKGVRVAYPRFRKNLAILHDPESNTYAVHDYVKNETLVSELETTREAGAFCKTVPVPEKAPVPEPADA